jgi:hypothetical protein
MHSIDVAASRLWELGDKLSRDLGQRRDTPGNEKWSGRWESNPHGRSFEAYKIRRFVSQMKTACDWRANFRVMRDNVGLRETTAPFAIDFRCRDPYPAFTNVRCSALEIRMRQAARGIWSGTRVYLSWRLRCTRGLRAISCARSSDWIGFGDALSL